MRKELSDVISIRLPPGATQRLEEVADREHLTFSAYVRRVLLNELDRHREAPSPARTAPARNGELRAA